jgi:hypothetical protein
LSPIGAPTTSRSPAANGVPSKATSPAFLRNLTVSGKARMHTIFPSSAR